jgi:hypothetical protein
MDGQMAIRRARSALQSKQGVRGQRPCAFCFLSIHKQTQFTSPRASFSSCCQPRMLLATHATFSRPRQRALASEPARLEAPCRLQHTGQGGQCLMSTGRCRQALARAHACGLGLGRMRTSQERQPAAALHTLRWLPGLTTSATPPHLLHMCCAVRTPRLFRGRARGFPQRHARRGAQGAIPVSGWQGGLLGSGPWPAPAGCAPPDGPAGPDGLAGPSRSIAAELLWRYYSAPKDFAFQSICGRPLEFLEFSKVFAEAFFI